MPCENGLIAAGIKPRLPIVQLSQAGQHDRGICPLWSNVPGLTYEQTAAAVQPAGRDNRRVRRILQSVACGLDPGIMLLSSAPMAMKSRHMSAPATAAAPALATA